MHRVVLAVIALSACVSAPLQVQPTDNREFQVERLFEHDGCVMYRFFDGSYRYFARCSDKKDVTTSWLESCGEDCVRSQELPAVWPRPD